MVDRGRSLGRISGGVRIDLKRDVSLGVDYTFGFANRYISHNLGANLNISF